MGRIKSVLETVSVCQSIFYIFTYTLKPVQVLGSGSLFHQWQWV